MDPVGKTRLQRLQPFRPFPQPRVFPTSTSATTTSTYLVTKIPKCVQRSPPFYDKEFKKTPIFCSTADSPVLKRTPPPVPPRSAKTIANLSATSNTERPSIVLEDTNGRKKKTPPPVPKKPAHLRLLPRHPPDTNMKSRSSTSDQHLQMRLFALLMSPTKPSSTSVETIDARNGNSTEASPRRRRITAIFGSTPHLDRLAAVDATGKNFDSNNNNCNDIQRVSTKERSDESRENNIHRRASSRACARSARRKSLPLLSKNAAAAIPRTTAEECQQSDGVSASTSHCNSSFGAEQGSVLSLSNRSHADRPPPPIPKKDYDRSKNDASNLGVDRTSVDNCDEAESVVFFSTISTVSSCGGDNRSNFANNNCRNYQNKSIRSSRRTLSAPNELLDAFVLEQSRRTVSIIERNARIIKWLYGCSKD